MFYTEVFGDRPYCSLIQWGEDVWNLVKGHPRCVCYGAAVSLSDPSENTGKIKG
ncbi:MAG: hypothetical protein ACI8TF_002694 [Paracoccaceae bacterium]|jgi:hypothetical protein